MARLPAAYDALLTGDRQYRLERAAPYRMHQRCAERFRVGRVLLAGDAAHVTQPDRRPGADHRPVRTVSPCIPALAAVMLDRADPALLDPLCERAAAHLPGAHLTAGDGEQAAGLPCQWRRRGTGGRARGPAADGPRSPISAGTADVREVAGDADRRGSSAGLVLSAPANAGTPGDRARRWSLGSCFRGALVNA